MLLRIVLFVFATTQASASLAIFAVDDLLQADRAFAAASAKAANVVEGLSPMFADDVAMPVPGSRFTTTKAEAIAALGQNADNLAGRADWTPVSGGISADGGQGFTFGYMTVRKPDVAEIRLKYLAYWIKTPAGWRVAVYRRRPRGEGAEHMAAMAPSLPARWTGAAADAKAIEAARQSLDQAERSFSTEAQSIGLGAAFAKWGRADAINMGPPDAVQFIVGAPAIAKSVGAGTPTNSSPVTWAPDRVIVASGVDLGVTIGMIRPNAPGADGKPQPPIPFFTIWRRDGPNGAWRYIAE
jgi:hypothetical protein